MGRGTVVDSIGDGSNVALGAKADSAATTDTGTFSLISLTKRLLQKWTAGIGIVAGEAHVGAVGGEGDLIDVTLSLDTSAYAIGDVLADTQVVSNALRKIDGTGILESLLVLDEDDQGQALDLLFFNANVSLGTENAAPSITDANMRNYLGRVPIGATDFNDWGGVRTATKTGIGLFLKSVSGSRDIYVAAVSQGTGTYTASGIRLRLGVSWN